MKLLIVKVKQARTAAASAVAVNEPVVRWHCEKCGATSDKGIHKCLCGHIAVELTYRNYLPPSFPLAVNVSGISGTDPIYSCSRCVKCDQCREPLSTQDFERIIDGETFTWVHTSCKPLPAPEIDDSIDVTKAYDVTNEVEFLVHDPDNSPPPAAPHVPAPLPPLKPVEPDPPPRMSPREHAIRVAAAEIPELPRYDVGSEDILSPTELERRLIAEQLVRDALSTTERARLIAIEIERRQAAAEKRRVALEARVEQVRVELIDLKYKLAVKVKHYTALVKNGQCYRCGELISPWEKVRGHTVHYACFCNGRELEAYTNIGQSLARIMADVDVMSVPGISDLVDTIEFDRQVALKQNHICLVCERPLNAFERIGSGVHRQC